MRYWKIKALLYILIVVVVIYTTYFSVTYDFGKIHPYSEVVGKAIYNGEILCYKTFVFTLTYLNETRKINMWELCNALINRA